jgi:hypothetical protein
MKNKERKKMKRNIIIIGLVLLLAAGLLLAGCTRVVINVDNGPTVTRNYDFANFTSIEVGFAFELEVIPADTYRVTITAGENLFDYIEVSKSGDTLKIDVKNLIINFRTSPKVEITMPELRGLNLSGAAKGSAKGFKSAKDFDGTFSGASELDMDMETGSFKFEASGASRVTGRLEATGADFALSGASRAKLDGSAGNIKLDGSGASQADLADFTVNDADINLSGASHASLVINGKLDVTLSGASSLEYGGNPTLGNLDITGGSQLRRQ